MDGELSALAEKLTALEAKVAELESGQDKALRHKSIVLHVNVGDPGESSFELDLAGGKLSHTTAPVGGKVIGAWVTPFDDISRYMKLAKLVAQPSEDRVIVEFSGEPYLGDGAKSLRVQVDILYEADQFHF